MSDRTVDPIESGTVLEENISFEDFARRYEGQSVEWHAGKVVEKVTNNTLHNLVQGLLYRLLQWYLEESNLGEAITAGVPMYIGEDVPAREPDLMVILTENVGRIEAQRINGAADIVVEIVSPGSSGVDHGEKLIEYEQAGVPEYWIIDPLRRLADVYILEADGHYSRNDADPRFLTSTLLQGFRLEKAILWGDALPKGSEIVQLVQAMRDN